MFALALPLPTFSPPASVIDLLIMYLLFKKEKQQLKSCREIKRIFCKEGSAVILKIHDNIMVDTWQGTDTIIYLFFFYN